MVRVTHSELQYIAELAVHSSVQASARIEQVAEFAGCAPESLREAANVRYRQIFGDDAQVSLPEVEAA